MKFLIFILILPLQLFADCITPIKFVPYPTKFKDIGRYQRVHPSGQYLLHSSMDYSHHPDHRGEVGVSPVVIFDIKHLSIGGQARYIETPMLNETYPLMTDWSIFASPDHRKDGMRYYSFSEIKKKGIAADFDFNDKDHNQYYHSIGELSSSGDKKVIRVTLLSRKTKEYELTLKNGRIVDHRELRSGSICDNIYESKADTFWAPVLSMKGDEIVTFKYENVHAIKPSSLYIFKIKEDYTCEIEDHIDFQTSKAQFSYPVEGKKGSITFLGPFTRYGENYVSLVYLYDRDTKQLKALTKGDEYNNIGFPGFTVDGRVIFPACKKIGNNDFCGAVVVDPNQIDTEGNVIQNSKTCINE